MKRYIHRFTIIVAFISLLLGSVHFLRVRSARGILLRGLKSFSEGLSPLLALLGLTGSVLALVIHAPYAAVSAVAGALLQVGYIRRVIRPHHNFDTLFGEDWQIQLAEKLPAQRHKQLLQRRWTWRMPRPHINPRWERDIVYYTVPATKDQPPQPLLCDLWLPPEGISASGLAFLYVHGGGYYTTSKDFGTRPFFRHLAAQGHIAMDINYRLAPQANLFEMLADVKHAVAWLKGHAVEFEANPARIVLAGGSAGAHLALLAAYAPHHPQLTPPDLKEQDLSVHAVVSYYGVIDMISAYRRMASLFTNMLRRPIPEGLFERPWVRRALNVAAWIRGVEPGALRDYMQENQAVLSSGLEVAMAQLLGGSPEQIPETYQLVSPLTYAGPGCPATLLFQGAHDYLLPIGPARKLHARLRRAGIDSVYVELPQTEHTFDQFLPEFSPPAQVALYDLDRFLALIN